jgi:hypothetical protein
MIKANTINWALGREEFSFNIVNLPFGIVLIEIFLTTIFQNLVFQKSCQKLKDLRSRDPAGCRSELPAKKNETCTIILWQI